jgi:hypothetical protein
MDFGAILGGGFCGIAGVWFLYLMFHTGRQTPMVIRIGLLMSGVSFMTYGVLAVLGGYGVAWATPEMVGWSFVPCLVCGVFAWVTSKRINRKCHDKDA